MDSLPGEDPSLPLDLHGSVTFSCLPDVSGDEVRVRVGGGGPLPDVAEDTVSPTRARTMKDFENQMTELRKENFNLKLRIYFLEERMQQKFDGPSEEVYRINIELKVELESLKRDLREREQLLIKASKAVESLAQGGDGELQHLKEEARKKAQHVETLTSRVNLLEEDLKTAHEEMQKALMVTEHERVLRLAAEQQLSALPKMQPKDLEVMAALEEKDRRLVELSLLLQNKDTLIQHLEDSKSQRSRSPTSPEVSESQSSPGESLSEEKIQVYITALEEKERELEALRTELRNEKNSLEIRIQSLQEELQQREAELSLEKKNALKRDKAIQGLTLALKTKEKENDELNSEVENVNMALAQAREATLTAQMQTFKGSEDCQVLLVEKESLLVELQSQNLNKDMENRKLLRKTKRADQELNDLRLERERLMNELDETQRQKNMSDKKINDLRNQLDKAHVEISEKEKAVECRYAVLLSERDQKLQTQESVITCLTDGDAEKDRLLQELTGTVREKDVELQQWVAKYHGLLKAKEELQRQNDSLVKETLAAQVQQPVPEMIQELEKTKPPEYANMMEALQKERDVFARLVESLKGADGLSRLQEELSMVVLLRKQLEEDIIVNWNLRKALEDSLKANGKEEETVSSWGDQTSYMSICLRELNHQNVQIDQLSLEDLRKKVLELLCVVKELRDSNEELRQKHLEFSKLDLLAKERTVMLDQNEFLEEAEESQTLTGSFQDETITLSGPLSDSSGKIITLDSLSGQCLSHNQPGSGSEPLISPLTDSSATGQSDDAHEKSSVAMISDGSGVVVPASSTEEQMKIANKPLDHLNTTGRDTSNSDLKNKSEEDLKGLIIQLRAQLQHLVQAKECATQPGGTESALAEKEIAKDPDLILPVNAEAEFLRAAVKDTATQTALVPSSTMKHEGKATTSDDKARRLRLSQQWVIHQQRAFPKNVPQEISLRTSRTNKSDCGYPFKKSRLPVLVKFSKSLGSLPGASHVDVHLQHRIFTLDEDLKGKLALSQAPANDLQQNGSECDASEHDEKLTGVVSLIKVDDTEADLTLVGDETKDESSKEQITSQEATSSKEEPILAVVKGLNQEFGLPEKQDSVTTSSDSKSLLSLSVDVSNESEIIDDVEVLRRKVKELKSELAKYRLLVSHSQATKPHSPSSFFRTVQSNGELPADDAFFPVSDTREHKTQAFMGILQHEEYRVQVKDLALCAAEKPDGDTVEKLKEMLLENEAELEKEQITNMHLLDEVYRLQTKLMGSSPSGLDSLHPLPANKQSCQRQQFRESHNVCTQYRHNLSSVVRAFEELLQVSEVDYFVAEGFREQLSQCTQLFERLAKQCLYGEPFGAETSPQLSLTPSMTDSEEMEKLSTLELARPKQEDTVEGDGEQPAMVPTQFPPELLMEHLQEIRMLRHQLEESIKTNDRLRKQLENQAADSAKNPGSADICIRDSEQPLPLTSEIYFLRKQNQVLNGMLAKGSQEKQKENEKLRESLCKRQHAAESLRKDHERIKEENEKLQGKVERQQEENERLTLEAYNMRNELSRLQVELEAKQHLMGENDKLLQSLRLELKVFEKLDKAIRSQKERSHDGSEECWKDQTRPVDLHELLTEIQNLRAQLERSIEANQALHGKLEEQLLRGKRDAVRTGSTLSILFKQESLHYATINEFKFPSADSSVLDLQQKYGCLVLPRQAEPALHEVDGSSLHSSSTGKSHDHPAVPGHCMWADKNGRHVLGSVEDYNSLRKQIVESRKLLSELERRLKEMEGEDAGAKPHMQVPHQSTLSRFSSTAGMIRHNLDEAARLLKALWRVSLPMKVVHSAAYSLQDEGLKGELHKLRKKLAEQEKKLQNTVKRLYSTNQLKENMERIIIDQLALTHDVLKKARGNLEVQPAENQKSAFNLSKTKVM